MFIQYFSTSPPSPSSPISSTAAPLRRFGSTWAAKGPRHLPQPGRLHEILRRHVVAQSSPAKPCTTPLPSTNPQTMSNTQSRVPGLPTGNGTLKTTEAALWGSSRQAMHEALPSPLPGLPTGNGTLGGAVVAAGPDIPLNLTSSGALRRMGGTSWLEMPLNPTSNGALGSEEAFS